MFVVVVEFTLAPEAFGVVRENTFFLQVAQGCCRGTEWSSNCVEAWAG